jgi:hypothetical protein
MVKNLSNINCTCKKTLSQIRKLQVRGLRSQKKRSLLLVNEHFSYKHNSLSRFFIGKEIGVFLLTLNNEKKDDIYTKIDKMDKAQNGFI